MVRWVYGVHLDCCHSEARVSMCDNFCCVLGDVPRPHNRATTSREDVGNYRLFHQLLLASKAAS